MEALNTWDVWNCSTMGPGVQSVMVFGHILMQMLPAGQYSLAENKTINVIIMVHYRMLGFDSAVCAVTSNQFGRATSSVPFLIGNVQCLGSEEALDQCSFPGWRSNNDCSHTTQDAGVVCKSEDGILFLSPNYFVCLLDSCNSSSWYSIQYHPG